MHYYIRKSFIVLLAMFICSCASVSQDLEVVNNANTKWQLKEATLANRGDELLVYGSLVSHNNAGLPNGYVVVSLLDKNDQVLSTHKADYRLLLGRNTHQSIHHYGKALFYLNIPTSQNYVSALATLEVEEETSM